MFYLFPSMSVSMCFFFTYMMAFCLCNWMRCQVLLYPYRSIFSLLCIFAIRYGSPSVKHGCDKQTESKDDCSLPCIWATCIVKNLCIHSKLYFCEFEFDETSFGILKFEKFTNITWTVTLESKLESIQILFFLLLLFTNNFACSDDIFGIQTIYDL